jgi:hypothetical protein
VPTSFKQAGNLDNEWFQAEDKEKRGILSFNTWQRIPQDKITPAIRKLALRAHHLYDVKRTQKKKNRVVINGSRQHPSTYSDTTSPVASQLQLRTFLAIMARRSYHVEQLDLTNAYLHASIKDMVLIIIPEGFPGENEVAILRQAGYGTKQGSRRFYDHTTDTLNSIGLITCPSEPCLFRYLGEEGACFVLVYVDDSLLGGDKRAVEKIKAELKTKFQCKFQTPEDFLGMDIKIHSPGHIELSMRSFSKKMVDTLNIKDNVRAHIYTPGRTDCKIIKPTDGDKVEHAQDKDDGQYRSKVGSLNWLIMCLRYDMIYATKELSRVLSSPTPLARSLLQRALLYAKRTSHATLHFRHSQMSSYSPPPTRKKPTDLDTSLYDFVDEYTVDDGIKQTDAEDIKQEYLYKGDTITISCQTDVDLAGQTETRQSTSGFLLYLDGALVHWRGCTERIVMSSTAAAEYVAMARGNTACKFVKDVLAFYGNDIKHNYHLYTDNQAAEHLCTQPNMSEASRGIDIRHHVMKQDYQDGCMRVGGVKSNDNDSDIITKNLPPQTHKKFCVHLSIFDDDDEDNNNNNNNESKTQQ